MEKTQELTKVRETGKRILQEKYDNNGTEIVVEYNYDYDLSGENTTPPKFIAYTILSSNKRCSGNCNPNGLNITKFDMQLVTLYPLIEETCMGILSPEVEEA